MNGMAPTNLSSKFVKRGTISGTHIEEGGSVTKNVALF